MKNRIPKKCRGCDSYEYICSQQYVKMKNIKFTRIFRDRFCPCTTCLVKPSCQEPKIQLFYYTVGKNKHKCKLLYEATIQFWEYIKKNNLRETKIKLKKKKKKGYI